MTYVVVLSQNTRSCNAFILNPYVHMLDDNNACIAFTRLTQYVDRCVLDHPRLYRGPGRIEISEYIAGPKANWHSLPHASQEIADSNISSVN